MGIASYIILGMGVTSYFGLTHWQTKKQQSLYLRLNSHQQLLGCPMIASANISSLCASYALENTEKQGLEGLFIGGGGGGGGGVLRACLGIFRACLESFWG